MDLLPFNDVYVPTLQWESDKKETNNERCSISAVRKGLRVTNPDGWV